MKKTVSCILVILLIICMPASFAADDSFADTAGVLPTEETGVRDTSLSEDSAVCPADTTDETMVLNPEWVNAYSVSSVLGASDGFISCKVDCGLYKDSKVNEIRIVLEKDGNAIMTRSEKENVGKDTFHFFDSSVKAEPGIYVIRVTIISEKDGKILSDSFSSEPYEVTDIETSADTGCPDDELSDNPPENRQTGDLFPVYFAALIISFAASLPLFIYAKKERK